MHENPLRSVRLAPGVALHSTDRGLLARTPSRWTRIDLHDRALEASLVAKLARGAALEVDDADESTSRAAAALERAGLLVRHAIRVLLVDTLGAVDLAEVEVVRSRPADVASQAGDLLVVVAAPDRRDAGELLERVVADRRSTLVAWIDERGVAIARDDGAGRGCPLCAWSMDGALVRYVVPGMALASAPRAYGEMRSLASIASGAIAAAIHDPSAHPRAGEVWAFERAGATASVRRIAPHPSCPCSSRPERDEDGPASVSWESLIGRRHAPVWPVERSAPGRAARVVYRRSRSAWKADPDALGVALGSGDGAETRALAEAIERFCLLHAPPDVRHRAQRELDAESLPSADIEALTFRPAEYTLPGFRFAPYSTHDPLDWSIARSLDGTRSLLVPTSLVGRVPRGSRALVDATSNGYACHVDRELAVEGALLELVERDALLLHAYAPETPLPRIGAPMPIESAVALLATQDIDLPVVLAIGYRGDGSLRCGSAAATTVDEALRRACAELRVALEGNPPTGAPLSLANPARRYEPGDHLAHHAGDRGRRAFDDLTRSTTAIGLADLRRRWPEETAATRLSLALAGRFDVWIVERSLPRVFGSGWRVVRALVPGLVELSWGLPYRRLASPRIAERLARAVALSDTPHWIA